MTSTQGGVAGPLFLGSHKQRVVNIVTDACRTPGRTNTGDVLSYIAASHPRFPLPALLPRVQKFVRTPPCSGTPVRHDTFLREPSTFNSTQTVEDGEVRCCNTRGQVRVASLFLQNTNGVVMSTAKRSHEGRPREKSADIRGRARGSASQGVKVNAVREGETNGNGGKVRSPDICWPLGVFWSPGSAGRAVWVAFLAVVVVRPSSVCCPSAVAPCWSGPLSLYYCFTQVSSQETVALSSGRTLRGQASQELGGEGKHGDQESFLQVHPAGKLDGNGGNGSHRGTPSLLGRDCSCGTVGSVSYLLLDLVLFLSCQEFSLSSVASATNTAGARWERLSVKDTRLVRRARGEPGVGWSSSAR